LKSLLHPTAMPNASHHCLLSHNSIHSCRLGAEHHCPSLLQSASKHSSLSSIGNSCSVLPTLRLTRRRHYTCCHSTIQELGANLLQLVGIAYMHLSSFHLLCALQKRRTSCLCGVTCMTWSSEEAGLPVCLAQPCPGRNCEKVACPS
jgi:hypothetical protein